jgi:signal peptidase II
MNRNLLLTALPVAVGALLVDQLTKSWAVSALDGEPPRHLIWTLQLNLAFNDGVAFSLGSGAGAWIAPIAIAVVVAVVLTSRTLEGRPAGLALGMIIGGALGNLADRLFRGNGGSVVDFIDLQWWPIFNVADACVVCGAILLAIVSLRSA